MFAPLTVLALSHLSIRYGRLSFRQNSANEDSGSAPAISQTTDKCAQQEWLEAGMAFTATGHCYTRELAGTCH
jgi:hypothetical protein